jgi:hypothetical protein
MVEKTDPFKTSGLVVFFMPEGPDCLDEAKKYCQANGLTPDTAKILKTNDGIIVKIR